MNVKDFVSELKGIVEEAKAKGITEIKADNLIRYLDEVLSSPEAVPSDFQLEQYRGELQANLESYRATVDSRLEMFRSVITSGQAAIKSSFLLNGGASVALLAFIGHMVQVRAPLVPQLAVCLLWFALGVLAIAVTSGLTYLSQWLYASGNDLAWKAGFGVNLLCIVFGFASYGLFVVGLFATYERLQGLS